MTTSYPRVRAEGEILGVDFGSASADRRVEIEVVVDRNAFGDVVGVEILDLQQQLASHVPLPVSSVDLPRWSYDDEIDAFYLRLRSDTATSQDMAIGTATLDQAGEMISLEISAER